MNAKVRYCHEALFSLNVTYPYLFLYAVVWPVGRLGQLFLRIEAPVNLALHCHYNSPVGGGAAFLALWFPCALPVFLTLHFLGGLRWMRTLVIYGGGIAALLTAPGFWYWMNRPQSGESGFSLAGLEMAVALVCGAFYVDGAWQAPAWTSALLVAAHWAFWCWLYVRPPWSGAPLPIVFPLLGLASTLVWAAYVSRLRSHNLHSGASD